MKTQAKHTPGEWHWWDRADGRPKKYDLAKLIGPRGKTILTLYGGEGKHALGKKDEDIANAALIASAPDLLAALKATREAMLRHAGWNQNFDASGKELPMTRPKDVQAADDLASAALLKAERTGG